MSVQPPVLWTIRPLNTYSVRELRLATRIFRLIDRGNFYLA